MTRLPITEILPPIWQRVLQCSSVAPQDNFFENGGTLWLADTLFAELAQACGREFPSAMICHAPTIASLAALLDAPSLPRFSPFVQTKPGNKEPPIFIAPGLEGSVRTFQLARLIRTEHPIFSIQAKGIDGLEEPLDRVEDMAEYYLQALKEMQPHGPYFLIGYSFGGLVTLEMAHRLTQRGEQIALLALLDTYPHLSFLPLGMRLRVLAQRAGNHVSAMRQLPLRDVCSYVALELKRRLLPGSRLPAVPGPQPPRLSFARTTVYAKQKAFLALARYQPRFYPGNVKFVRAEIVSHFPDDPAAIWARMSESFELETIPGGHLDMLTTHAQDLAHVLTRYLSETFSE